MTDYSSSKRKYNKNKYTPKQVLVLSTVITEHKGNVIAAAKAAGYSNPYQVARALREELIELAETVIATLAIPAALKVGEAIVTEDVIPQLSEKLKAAQLVLDRTNAKTDKLSVEGEVKGGIFILPNKRPIDEQG